MKKLLIGLLMFGSISAFPQEGNKLLDSSCYKCYAGDSEDREVLTWYGYGDTRARAKREALRKCERRSDVPETCEISRCSARNSGC